MTKVDELVNFDIKAELDLIQTKLEFDQMAIGPISTPITLHFYKKWLMQNCYGSMNYLKDHLPKKENPHLLDAKLKSVISISHSYFPTYRPIEKIPARLSLYAKNEDYHYWLKDKLNQSIEILKENHPDQLFLPYVDSGPVLERNWAYENGMGWFGKNTCLIHPKKGSLFFIAEILTSLPTTKNHDFSPLPDFCGKCTKCMDICPTSAIQENKNLIADRCISYLTIEAKTVPPPELRSKIGDWFFGCDLCQTVCPWNQKVFKTHLTEAAFSTEPLLKLTHIEKNELIVFFRFLLTSSYKKIQKRFIGTALSRSGAKGLIRNALVVIANQQLTELTQEVSVFISNEYFSELAQWTLESLVNQKTET